MDASDVWHFIQWIHFLALSVWIGGITFLSSIAAPAAHRSMAAKSVAGQIVGNMLKKFNGAELTACLILIVTSFSALRFIQFKKEGCWVMIGVILLMACIAGFYTFALTPQMDSIKEQTPGLDALSADHSAKVRFNRFHRTYVRLMGLNLMLALGVLYGSVVLFK